ncbi:MAG: hypothetical protein NTV73_02250 [Hyphomicrobiales bacterium]|nr:hypothetical protein [Hyphomicrobiales bacterium]
MNQLLSSLEAYGYLESKGEHAPRARTLQLTQRGREAYSKIHDILHDTEREWSVELGQQDFGRLKELLLRVWTSSQATKPRLRAHPMPA